MSKKNDVPAMLATPALFGFEWRLGRVEKGSLGWDNIPYIFVNDMALARSDDSFGDAILTAAINGTSIKVKCQTIRDALLADSTLQRRPDEMKEWILNSVLGITVRQKTVITVTKKIYMAEDGTEFDDKAACMAHNVDLKLAAQEENEVTQ